MKRRHFLSLLGSAAVWPKVGRAQQLGRVARVGFIEAGSKQANLVFLSSFKEGLLAFGWIEGRNTTIMDRWAEARNDLLPEIVAGLIKSGVDVLVTAAAPASLAAKQATSSIPIVAVGVPDPVGVGLVESLAHPGGNITGLSSLSVDLTAKRMQLLHQALPTAARIAVVWNPKDAGAILAVRDAKAEAKTLGLHYLSLGVITPDEIERAFSGLPSQLPDALFVINDPLTVANRDRIVALATEQSLPVFAGFRAFAVSGAQISFGTNLTNDFRRAAGFVDKILKGANTADLPVEQPTQFELVINLKSAKALGLTIPPSILARADELIE